MNEKNYSVAVYCRVANSNTKDLSSIDNQKQRIENFCKDNCYIIVDYYIDQGYSGLNLNRPSFQRLLQDINQKRIDLVITTNIARLGRDSKKISYYINDYFASRNVKFLTLDTVAVK